MIKIAVYGKGGIGKSTTVSNLSAAFSESGLTVMQIGCDPKADSTIKLLGGRQPATVLDMMRAKGAALELGDIVTAGYGGVLCVEAGGPPPGLGCAGRGIIAAIEKLEEKGAFAFYKPDVVLYDVLGDVVCGGFAMPIREGYARDVFVMTSGENMAIHAAANIAAAVGNFASRGYARLSGVILNRRNVDREEEKVKELAEDIHSRIVGELDFSREVQKADEAGMTAMEMFPGGDAAKMYRKLAKSLLAVCGDEK